jgi:transposase
MRKLRNGGMRVATILNRVEPYKSFVYGKVALLEDDDRLSLEVRVQPRKGSRPICSGCHRPGPGYDRLPERKFEFVPLWQIAVLFVYAMRRVECPRCGVTVEEVPWAEGKNRLTRSYQWFLAGWAKRLSWSGAADAFHTTWDHVRNAVDHAVRWGLVHRDLKGIEAIGVDEVQWKRGQQYLTLVYQIDAGAKRLLWIGKERTEASFREFFDLLGDEVSAGLRYVCSDMWKAYLNVIAERAQDAIHILDRFHIMAKMNEAIDEVRRAETKRLQADGYEPLLKNSRWCLLKRPENRTDKQTVKLRELLRYNLQSVRAHLQREDFQRFWEYTSPTWACKFLDEWTTRVMRSKIEPMKKVAKMLRRHRALILNWFEARGTMSSGVVEGLNNKVKLTTRKSYGFRTEEAVKLALYHNLGALPEPNVTHRFF